MQNVRRAASAFPKSFFFDKKIGETSMLVSLASPDVSRSQTWHDNFVVAVAVVVVPCCCSTLHKVTEEAIFDIPWHKKEPFLLSYISISLKNAPRVYYPPPSSPLFGAQIEKLLLAFSCEILTHLYFFWQGFL